MTDRIELESSRDRSRTATLVLQRAGTAAVVFALVGVSCVTSAWAQTAAENRDERSGETTAAMEEIEVRGRRPLGLMRAELQSARERVWEAFNEITPNEEFHIHCATRRTTGTRIPQRVCRPQFANVGTSESGRALLERLFQNCAPAGPTEAYSQLFDACAQVALSAAQVAMSAIHYKEQLLEQEIRRLALEDPSLHQAILDYLALEQEYKDARERR